MNHLEFSKGFAAPLAGLMAVGLAMAALALWVMGPAASSAESGPLEWAQEAALLAAIVFSGAAALGLRGPERLAAYLATLLYLVFFLRELELPVSGLTTGYLASDAFRRHEATALVVLVLPYAVARRRFWRDFLAYALGGKGWPFMLAALLVGVGAALDGAPGVAGVPHLGTFMEETAELLGYLVLAAAAGVVLCRAHGEAADGLDAASALPCGSGGP